MKSTFSVKKTISYILNSKHIANKVINVWEPYTMEVFQMVYAYRMEATTTITIKMIWYKYNDHKNEIFIHNQIWKWILGL